MQALCDCMRPRKKIISLCILLLPFMKMFTIWLRMTFCSCQDSGGPVKNCAPPSDRELRAKSRERVSASEIHQHGILVRISDETRLQMLTLYAANPKRCREIESRMINGFVPIFRRRGFLGVENGSPL